MTYRLRLADVHTVILVPTREDRYGFLARGPGGFEPPRATWQLKPGTGQGEDGLPIPAPVDEGEWKIPPGYHLSTRRCEGDPVFRWEREQQVTGLLLGFEHRLVRRGFDILCEAAEKWRPILKPYENSLNAAIDLARVFAKSDRGRVVILGDDGNELC